jgi:small subunit ribosomal protein S8
MEEHEKQFLRILLKYTEGRIPVISGIQRISRPGLRAYGGYRKFKRLQGPIGVAILSTPKGVMSHQKAHHGKVGGEVLCNVW